MSGVTALEVLSSGEGCRCAVPWSSDGETAHRGRMEPGIEQPQQKDTSLRKPKLAPESYTIVIKDAQPAMPDEIWISVIVSYAAEVYQKAAQRLQVLYYHCTLQWLQLTAYLYFHADSAKRVDLFSVLS